MIDQLQLKIILVTLGICNLPFLVVWLGCQARHESRETAKILNSDLPNGPTAEDRRLLFQEVGHDLWTYKASQWNIVYYAILLFGAVIGILVLIDSPTWWMRLSLYLICIAIVDFSLHQLLGLQHEIIQARIRLPKYDDNLFRIGLYWKTPQEYAQVLKDYQGFWRAARYLIIFTCSISVAFFIASLMLLFLKWKS